MSNPAQQHQKSVVRWPDVTPVEMITNLFRRTLGETASIQVVEIRAKQGVRVPLHKHPHEQVGYVVSGELEITIAGVAHRCKSGDSYVILGNVEHEALFVVESTVIDCFSPPREDYR